MTPQPHSRLPAWGGPGPERQDTYRGALVGVAVGDGLGAPFEGRPGPVSAEEIEDFAAAGPLRTTDDTTMTIGVAESLLHRDGVDEDHLAATFAAAYASDPHRGYGAGAAVLLDRIAAGDDWRTAAAEQFGGQGSFGNGAAMRSTPFGLAAAGYPQQAAELARRAARVTHTHPQATEAAAAQAAAVSLVLTLPLGQAVDGPHLTATLGHLLADTDLRQALATAAALATAGTPGEIAQTLGTGVRALEAVPAALCAFLRHQGSFSDTVLFAVSLGGDTDTIAAMAAALAGAHLGCSAIPQSWVDRTEGARRLTSLADRFAHRHTSPSRTT